MSDTNKLSVDINNLGTDIAEAGTTIIASASNAISTIEIDSQPIINEGTVFVHGFLKDVATAEKEVAPVANQMGADFHFRLLQLETFVAKVETRLRALRFW